MKSYEIPYIELISNIDVITSSRPEDYEGEIDW